jgi:hypothetical protein
MGEHPRGSRAGTQIASETARGKSATSDPVGAPLLDEDYLILSQLALRHARQAKACASMSAPICAGCGDERKCVISNHLRRHDAARVA